MEPEFKLQGLLQLDGFLNVMIRRRECPFYEHAWYAEEANWLVADIEISADRFNSSFTRAVHINSLIELRDNLSRAKENRHGGFSTELRSHDGGICLQITATANDDEIKASFEIHNRNTRARLELEEVPYEHVAVALHGLEKIIQGFPIRSSGTESNYPNGSRVKSTFWGKLRQLLSPRGDRGSSRDNTMQRPTELYMEYEGRCVAKLIDQKYSDMFWTSFKIIPMTEDTTMIEQLQSEEFWNSEEFWRQIRKCGVTYRYTADGQIAFGTFPGGTKMVRNGRISLRSIPMNRTG
jgi:hypothetical protein